MKMLLVVVALIAAGHERRDSEAYPKHHEARNGVSRCRLRGTATGKHEVRKSDGERKRRNAARLNDLEIACK
jgi:hypothetical protein